MAFKRLFKTLRWPSSRPGIRRRLIVGAGVMTFLLTIIVALRGYTALAARGQIYTLDTVPARPVAIIFGAEVYPDGTLSAMLADRVKMGAELYQAGKVKALLLTGDNHVIDYNEPEAMRRYGLALGVPGQALVLDYAGFRTYDSCYRARDTFQVGQAILVTQDFHLDRALLVCNQLGIDSVGVAADVLRPEGYGADMMFYSESREFSATALSLVDLITYHPPTFLGEPLPIVVH